MGEVINLTKDKVQEQLLDIANSDLFNLPCPENINEEDIPEVLKMIRVLTKWGEGVEKYALERAKNGAKYKGFELKEGRTMPKFKDEARVAQLMRKNGYDVMEYRVMSPSNIKKLIGCVKFDELLSGELEAKVGKMSLVEVEA